MFKWSGHANQHLKFQIFAPVQIPTIDTSREICNYFSHKAGQDLVIIDMFSLAWYKIMCETPSKNHAHVTICEKS